MYSSCDDIRNELVLYCYVNFISNYECIPVMSDAYYTSLDTMRVYWEC